MLQDLINRMRNIHQIIPEFFIIYNFPFGCTKSQALKELKKNVAIIMENEDLQKSLTKTTARVLIITKIHLLNNRHMINRAVDALNRIITQYTIAVYQLKD